MQNTEPTTTNPVQPPLDIPSDMAREIKNWILTVAIAAVIVIAIFLYRSNRETNENTASRMLSEARNIQALQAVINQYPSTSAARLSLLQVAKAQYDNGDYIASQASYREFLAKYPTHPMVLIAELGQVHCTEGMGQAEQAMAAYTDFASRNKNSFLAPVALFGKARCLKTLKRYAEAKAVYEDFLVTHPKSDWQNEVEEALKQLVRESRIPSVKI